MWLYVDVSIQNFLSITIITYIILRNSQKQWNISHISARNHTHGSVLRHNFVANILINVGKWNHALLHVNYSSSCSLKNSSKHQRCTWSTTHLHHLKINRSNASCYSLYLEEVLKKKSAKVWVILESYVARPSLLGMSIDKMFTVDHISRNASGNSTPAIVHRTIKVTLSVSF